MNTTSLVKALFQYHTPLPSHVRLVRRVLIVLSFTLPSSVFASPLPVQARPNIVFVLADDLGYGDLGSYGSQDIATPHLDRLAQEGLRFTQFYTNGATCTPTRISLLTGHYPQRFGFREGLKSASQRGIPAGVPTLPFLLQRAGYTTMHIGKWHVGHAEPAFRPLAKGYDDFFGFLHAWFLPKTYRNPLLQRNEAAPTRHAGHMTDILTAEAVAFLHRQADTQQPFFLSLWYFNPHTPHQPPARWAKHYPDTKWGRFQALVSTLDENVGVLLKILQETNLAQETLLIFASDNGGAGERLLPRTFNGPLRGVKNQFTEGGIRVPLIVRWPGRVPAGVVHDERVISFDWFPTLADIGGADRSAVSVPGRNIEPILYGRQQKEQKEIQQPVFWEDFHNDAYRFAVRHTDWKLVFEDGRSWLFDLSHDLSESTDVAQRQPDIVKDLTARYHTWRLHTAQVPYTLQQTTGKAHVSAQTISLNAPHSAVLIQDQSLLDPHDGEFSFATWLCPSPRQQPDRVRTILHKGTAWRLSWQPTGRLRLKLSGATISGSIPIPRHGCSHIAFAVFHPGLHLRSTARGRAWLYVNGVLDGSTITPRPLLSNNQDVYVGQSASGANPFFGQLVAPSFYNTALTVEDVQALIKTRPPDKNQ